MDAQNQSTAIKCHALARDASDANPGFKNLQIWGRLALDFFILIAGPHFSSTLNQPQMAWGNWDLDSDPDSVGWDPV